MRRTMAQFGFVQHHPGEERAQRERDVKQFYRAEGDAQRQRQYREREQFARAGGGAAREDPRHQAAANQHHNGDKRHHFSDGYRHIDGQRGETDIFFFHHSGDGRQQDQRQDHHQIFNDQPADGDLPPLTINKLSFF